MRSHAEVIARLEGYAFLPISLGESGARMWRCTREGSPSYYLKTSPVDAALRLDREAERLRWMRERGLLVPAVRDYVRVDNQEYLLLDDVEGVVASDPGWRASAGEVVRAIGDVLARLHCTSVADCPFDERLAVRVAEARRRVEAGLVCENDFDESRLGRSAQELLELLLSSMPGDEDVVLTHGDFTLENIILGRASNGELRVAALIDCGRAGIADRHQDLALAIRGVTDAFGAEWVKLLRDSYGLADIDARKIDFYLLLDELF